MQFESVSNNVEEEIEFKNNSISFEYLALSFRKTKSISTNIKWKDKC